MTIAQKDHGPCDRCGGPIEAGQEYSRGLRPIAEGDDLSKSFHHSGAMVIPVKRHRLCHRMPNHPNIPYGFGRRMICHCGRCAHLRFRKKSIYEAGLVWGPGWGQQLRDNREVLDALAELVP